MLRFQILVPFIHEKKKTNQECRKTISRPAWDEEFVVIPTPPPAPPTPPVVRAAADGKIKK